MDFFKINSKSIKPPKEISVSFENLDKAERTMNGTMVIDLIGNKRRVDVSWDYLPKDEMKILASETKSGTFVTVSFHDTETGEMVTMTARPKDMTYQPYYDWVKSKVLWKSVAISFIER